MMDIGPEIQHFEIQIIIAWAFKNPDILYITIIKVFVSF